MLCNLKLTISLYGMYFNGFTLMASLVDLSINCGVIGGAICRRVIVHNYSEIWLKWI